MGISVLTLTYQRYEILQEAIQSFLEQDYDGECEMVIINDSPLVKYTLTHDRIRVINCDRRFDSIGYKLEFGYKQCKYDYIYRLDDDDLLTPWALSLSDTYVKENIGFDIYRSEHMYYFCNNIFVNINGNINNGNMYTKEYLDRITFPKENIAEDFNITFEQGGKIKTVDKGKYTMIYRWGMNTYHVSGMGNVNNQEMFDWTDKHKPHTECGVIELKPSFKPNTYYYDQILEYHKKEREN